MKLTKFFKEVDLNLFLKLVEVPNPAILKEQINHFNEHEAEVRDEILEEYFGEKGLKVIIEEVSSEILRVSYVKKVLDLGCSSGYFTNEIYKTVSKRMENLAFFGLDPSLKSLRKLVERNPKINPILGVAEDISGSIAFTGRYLDLPKEFDFIYSILTLHHCLNVERVFKNVSRALSKKGVALIIDLCEHQYEEFKASLKDVHLGFNLEDIEEKASRYFNKVEVKKLTGVKCAECKCLKKSVDLFRAKFMK